MGAATAAAQDPAAIPRPEWVEIPSRYPVDRSLGGVLSDVASRAGRRGLDQYHPSSFWAHEGVHLINAQVRDGHRGENGLYVLDGYAARIAEPGTTLTASLARVPPEYRDQSAIGTLFDRAALRAWNNRPLYAADEWVAYQAGAAWGIENNHRDRGPSIRFAIDCGVVTSCVALSSDDPQLCRFLAFAWERTLWLVDQADDALARERIAILARGPPCAEWRTRMQHYLGRSWWDRHWTRDRKDASPAAAADESAGPTGCWRSPPSSRSPRRGCCSAGS
jgi:hypothetical protein